MSQKIIKNCAWFLALPDSAKTTLVIKVLAVVALLILSWCLYNYDDNE
jgi:hypothetical protein